MQRIWFFNMVIVFDLDDTLYDEMSFVHSGLKAVSKYLEDHFEIPLAASQEFWQKRLMFGRAGILDDILKHFNLYSKKNVRKCLSVYRAHKPEIHISFYLLKEQWEQTPPCPFKLKYIYSLAFRKLNILAFCQFRPLLNNQLQCNPQSICRSRLPFILLIL